MPDTCSQCTLPEPEFWCWEHRICCPLGRAIRDPHPYDLVVALRIVIWLLAELKHG